MCSAGGSRPASARPAAVDVVLLLTLVGAATLVTGGSEGGFGAFPLFVGAAAASLIGVGALMCSDRRAGLIAGALGVHTGITLLVAVGGERGPVWTLLANLATLGLAGLLVRAAVRPLWGRRERAVAVGALGALVVVLTGMATVAVAGVLYPMWTPGAVDVAVAGLIGWTVVAAGAVLLAVTGSGPDGPLPRRVGLAIGLAAAAHAVSSGVVGAITGPVLDAVLVGSAVMTLVAAISFLLSAAQSVEDAHEAARSRLVEAEATVAGMAERDHELRNLVAGISGAARVLNGMDPQTAPGGRELLAATEAELDRLRRMLDGRPAEPPRAEAAVGRVVQDLALMHRANGLDVDVQVDGDPHVRVDDGVLAQVLTNLLSNCARHAPGAHVRVHAAGRGPKVRIEVADDGPGLPARSTARLLRRGVRGPGSTGAGLGLAICTDLVESARGTFTMVSTGSGCTAVLELPTARRRAVPPAVNV